jgi:hypothetical protein
MPPPGYGIEEQANLIAQDKFTPAGYIASDGTSFLLDEEDAMHSSRITLSLLCSVVLAFTAMA